MGIRDEFLELVDRYWEIRVELADLVVELQVDREKAAIETSLKLATPAKNNDPRLDDGWPASDLTLYVTKPATGVDCRRHDHFKECYDALWVLLDDAGFSQCPNDEVPDLIAMGFNREEQEYVFKILEWLHDPDDGFLRRIIPMTIQQLRNFERQTEDFPFGISVTQDSPKRWSVEYQGKRTSLTKTEFNVWHEISKHVNNKKSCPTTIIMENNSMTMESVHGYAKKLKKKMEEDLGLEWIGSDSGEGYKFREKIDKPPQSHACKN